MSQYSGIPARCYDSRSSSVSLATLHRLTTSRTQSGVPSSSIHSPSPSAWTSALESSARDSLGQMHERGLKIDLVFLEEGELVPLLDQTIGQKTILNDPLVELD